LNNFVSKVPANSNTYSSYTGHNRTYDLRKEPTVISEKENEDTYGDEVASQQ
jgi:hypothetical protein